MKRHDGVFSFLLHHFSFVPSSSKAKSWSVELREKKPLPLWCFQFSSTDSRTSNEVGEVVIMIVCWAVITQMQRKKECFFTRRLNSHRDFPTDVGCKGGYSRKVLKQNCKLLYYVCIRQRLLQIYQTTSVVTGAIAEAACQNWFVLSWQSQQEDFFQNEVFTSRAEDTLPFYCLFEWNNFFFHQTPCENSTEHNAICTHVMCWETFANDPKKSTSASYLEGYFSSWLASGAHLCLTLQQLKLFPTETAV